MSRTTQDCLLTSCGVLCSTKALLGWGLVGRPFASSVTRVYACVFSRLVEWSGLPITRGLRGHNRFDWFIDLLTRLVCRLLNNQRWPTLHSFSQLCTEAGVAVATSTTLLIVLPAGGDTTSILRGCDQMCRSIDRLNDRSIDRLNDRSVFKRILADRPRDRSDLRSDAQKS